ncbi:hypothetical protein GCT13_33625 [Paraburkholderia sp. CNPSo 3157]|uniref:Uncharacterized protein n=1 Tax=Paraburkholderia franconis TaxID=2654983 RepID=A0A7X1NHH5_9BURK|nr:hypothetical protein [Paraburkholderia franconis]MPW21681.1 hypothetical protein [Paraburkholderia franconis]
MPLAFAIALRFQRAAGIRDCVAISACRWHPRLRGYFRVPLASAMRLAARALPLCGAALTFFAAAKKVSKESGFTPPILDLYPRALNVPMLRAAVCWLMFVANILAKRLTRFMHARYS